jgi:coenzyme PQQ precursor peptide PqqA
MSAYVALQQAEFTAEPRGYSATKHQQEVGAGYFDEVTRTVQRAPRPWRLRAALRRSSSTLGARAASQPQQAIGLGAKHYFSGISKGAKLLAVSRRQRCRSDCFTQISGKFMNKWSTPRAVVIRLGMEINSYVAHR